MRGAAQRFWNEYPRRSIKRPRRYAPVFVNTEENLANSAMAFTRFTANLASTSRNDGLNQFGLIGTDFIKSMGNSQLCFLKLGELDLFNMVIPKRVAEPSTTTQKIALAMADMTGTKGAINLAGLDAERRDEVTSNPVEKQKNT